MFKSCSLTQMKDGVMSCIGRNCFQGELLHYATQEEAKRAHCRDKELSKLLKEHHKDDLKRLKLLLLGTGESGKSTITKQMRIIHINGFDTQERVRKITDIRRNIKESIVMILLAMQQLGISLEHGENQQEMDFILKKAGDDDVHNTKEFMEYTARLWEDGGVQECFSRSHEYQLLDSAKYFLDRIGDIRQTDYIPTDQDILRCRVTTTSIQHIEFDVPDAGQQVKFSVYDVGGQRGERKKWIQMFDSVEAILFLADCSSLDQNLREDSSKNRLLEALEIFEQVWKNRFLRNVSILLFINKIDILSEKVCRGRSIHELVEKYPDIFPDYDTFNPSNTEKLEFLDSFLKRDGDSKKRRGSRSGSRPDVNPDIIKTAVYIKHLFIKIVKGEISLRPDIQHVSKDWHQHHTCEYFYTCAVDTNNIQHVLNGCRNLIIRKHLERFGII
ncbi:hypothetical protein CHS0354_018994 [Potamilus streckersoni]|uniref:Guanine nucleotide-binding protein G(s) subunit alpha n=1 Tax=Potamilus streckersoni TaxID=2493646 RepID=A0AAE0SRK4_9BIVA|nr:hypothetical protein CHS0354_018994 [Potamilus streckersoni]